MRSGFRCATLRKCGTSAPFGTASSAICFTAFVAPEAISKGTRTSNLSVGNSTYYNFRFPFLHSDNVVSAMKERKSELFDIASNTSVPFFSYFGKR